jgi:hypothetical protein
MFVMASLSQDQERFLWRALKRPDVPAANE